MITRLQFVDACIEPILTNSKNVHKLLKLAYKGSSSQTGSTVRFELSAYDMLATPDGYQEFRKTVVRSVGCRSEDYFEGGFGESLLLTALRCMLLETDEGIAVTAIDLFDTDARG